jgi:hypothetical protein
MLANSPHLPLLIDHLDEDNVITTEDEEGIILALQHHDRVRRIRLRNSMPNLQRFIIALDGEFPILEYLLIHHPYSTSTGTHDTSLNLPETFRAPHLRQLSLMDIVIPIESSILTTANLVNLVIELIPPSTYSHLNALLQQISLMPQLEILCIFFSSQSPSDDVERQLLPTAIMAPVTLPNLRVFGFQGASAYLEALLPWVAFPLLEEFHVSFLNYLAHSIPHLQQFMIAAENFRPIGTATTTNLFEDCLFVTAYPRGEEVHTLSMRLNGSHLDSQFFHVIGAVFSTVEHLTLQHDKHLVSSEWNNEADPT